MSHFLTSTKVRAALLILGALIVLLVVFGLGVAVGYNRAGFAFRFDQNYYKNFGMTPQGGMFGMNAGPAPSSIHGVVGTVIDVATSTISVQDPKSNEQFIEVSSGTAIREMNNTISITDIKDGDQITVIGSPNDQGEIDARFIRVFTASSSMPQNQ